MTKERIEKELLKVREQLAGLQARQKDLEEQLQMAEDAEKMKFIEKNKISLERLILLNKVSEEEINQKVNEESWLVGDEIAELFDVEVEEGNSAAAYAGSFFTDSYKNVPQNVCEKKMAVPETEKTVIFMQ